MQIIIEGKPEPQLRPRATGERSMMMKKRRSVNHFGMMCPVPGCGHIGAIITKAHCEIAHGMTKEEVYKLYGESTEVVYDPHARRMNTSLYKGEYEDEFTEII